MSYKVGYSLAARCVCRHTSPKTLLAIPAVLSERLESRVAGLGLLDVKSYCVNEEVPFRLA